jgi:23S rRNA pseudouridine1911/1915/1917 synthase
VLEASYSVVHEDAALVVVDKAAGVAAAPTQERDRGCLLEDLQRDDPSRGQLYVVHRLDVATSGLMVFAKTKASAAQLSEMFQAHRLTREYLAIVKGTLTAHDRLVKTPVKGRPARTRLTTLRQLGKEATLAKAVLETGRTHQLRIHLSSLGHPVLGDRRYGRPTRSSPKRLALHAARLAFTHPTLGSPLDLQSNLPEALQVWMETLQLSTENTPSE